MSTEAEYAARRMFLLETSGKPESVPLADAKKMIENLPPSPARDRVMQATDQSMLACFRYSRMDVAIMWQRLNMEHHGHESVMMVPLDDGRALGIMKLNFTPQPRPGLILP